MVFISEQGLVRLKNYQYKSGGYSWLDNKFNPFWLWVVELVPLWVAPNLLTFIGFIFMISSCAIILIYDSTLTQDIPQWVFLLSAFSIFVYQTLDAIDGKQARRTQSSSPLGQLFDHGCDSFVLTFFLLGCASAVKLQRNDLFYLFLGLQINLWGLNQKEHHTGVMHTHICNIGVTEAELLVMGIQLVSAIFGQDIWKTTPINFIPLSFLPYASLREQPSYMLILGIVLPLIYLSGLYIFISNIIGSNKKLRAFLEWVPLVVFWILQFVWLNLKIYDELAGVILLNFGIIISQICCKMIICNTTRDQPAIFHLEQIPFFIVSLILYIFEGVIHWQLVRVLFWVNFIVTLFICLFLLQSIIGQITNHLGIRCFKIPYKKQ